MPPMAQTELTIRALARSRAFVAGLLLLAVGLGDVVAGRTKLAQYQAVLAQEVVTPPRDPATLFPKVTEAEEQRAVARAKLGFYNVLFLAGQILTLAGLVLLIAGLIALRRRATRAPEVAVSR
jgi:hypothetical protein